MKELPKVSVIMRVSNCEDTLAKTFDSIVAQTYANWELVMCDDGSTDGTYALTKEHERQFPDRIVLL